MQFIATLVSPTTRINASNSIIHEPFASSRVSDVAVKAVLPPFPLCLETGELVSDFRTLSPEYREGGPLLSTAARNSARH